MSLAALAGCWGGDGALETDEERLVRSSDAATGLMTDLPKVDRPVEVNGIEVHFWSIDPLGAPLGRALASFAMDGGRLDPEKVRVWSEQGFRLVEIPIAFASELEGSLPHIDAVRRVWLGQPTRWSDLSTRALASDGGALGGRPTRVRASLRIRSWIEPGVRRRPIRTELALTGVPLDGTDTRPILLRDLLLSHRLDPGTALVIVPASPDEAWITDSDDEPAGDSSDQATPEPIDLPDPAQLGSGPSGANEDAEGLAAVPLPGEDQPNPVIETAGPLPATPVSLGEAMLTTPNRIESRPRRPSREAIVIIPGDR